MTKKQKTDLERLENEARKINKKLREAKQLEAEKRSIGGFRDNVTEATESYNELLERQTGYDTNDKARLFSFGAFDGAIDGSLVWVLLGSVYAVEKDPNERFTTLKTADGPLGVKQSPDEVFSEFTRVRFAGHAEQVREMQGELLRREDKIAAGKAKQAAKDAKKAGVLAGPDFQAVSDRVSIDSDVPDDNLGEYSLGPDNV